MRKKRITLITDKDFHDVINNSVQGAASRLVGSAAEQKKLFVLPIANLDGTPNVGAWVQRLATEAEEAIQGIEEDVENLHESLTTPPPADSIPLLGVFLSYDEETETLNIVGEKGIDEEDVVRIVGSETDKKFENVGDSISALSSNKQDKLSISDNYSEKNPVATRQTVVNEVALVVDGADKSFDTLKKVADKIIANTRKIEQNETTANKNTVAIEGQTQSIANVQAEVNALRSFKQDVVAFDGSYDKNTNKAATVSTVTTEIAKVVANAPESFNTLEEIARWIAEHPNSVAEINAKIAQNTQSINGLSEGLNERVKFTDYATDIKPGLVRGGIDYGVIITSRGYMELYPATDEDIRNKSVLPRAITPKNIDYAVLNSLENGSMFVDESVQVKICEKLGAVHQPNVPKMNADFIVVLRANANNENVITQLWKLSMGWDIALHEESIPIRDGDGNLYVADPTLPYHAVNKKHFDEKLGSIDTALDEIIAIQNALIGTPFEELHEYAQSLKDGGEV